MEVCEEDHVGIWFAQAILIGACGVAVERLSALRRNGPVPGPGIPRGEYMAVYDAIRRWIRSRLGRDSADRRDPLLEHFFLQLQDEFLYAEHPSGDTHVDNQAIAQQVRDLLAAPPPHTWERAYEIQRLLVYLKPDRKLAIEADRRIAEAEAHKLPSAPKYRAQLDTVNTTVAAAVARAASAAAALASTPGGENRAQVQAQATLAQQQADAVQADASNQRRAILAAALDDLQWFYQKRNLVRTTLADSASNIVCFGLWTMCIVASPFLFFLFERLSGSHFFSNIVQTFPNYGLYTAMSFGMLGAFFSRLTSLKFTGDLTVEDAQNLFSGPSLIVRGAVGTCGAIIMYFLLRTQILGLVAPDLAKLSYEVQDVQTMLVKGSVLIPSKDWCLLVVWSFLAGFSEKLVPDSLTRVESQASGKK